MMFSAVTKAALFFIAVNSVAAAPMPQTKSGNVVNSVVDLNGSSKGMGSSSGNAFANSFNNWSDLNTAGGSTVKTTGDAVASAKNFATAANDAGHSTVKGFAGADSRAGGPAFTDNKSWAEAVGDKSTAAQNSVASAENQWGKSDGSAGSSAVTKPNGDVHVNTGTFAQNQGWGNSNSDAGAGTVSQLWREKGTTDFNSHSDATNGGAAGAKAGTDGNIDPWFNSFGTIATTGNANANAGGQAKVDLVDSTFRDFHKKAKRATAFRA